MSLVTRYYKKENKIKNERKKPNEELTVIHQKRIDNKCYIIKKTTNEVHAGGGKANKLDTEKNLF